MGSPSVAAMRLGGAIARKTGHLPLGTFDRNLGKIEGAEKLEAASAGRPKGQVLDAPLREALDTPWPSPSREGGLSPWPNPAGGDRSDAKPPRLCVDGESRSGVSRDRCRRTNANLSCAARGRRQTQLQRHLAGGQRGLLGYRSAPGGAESGARAG